MSLTELDVLLSPTRALVERLPEDLRTAFWEQLQGVGCILQVAEAQAAAASGQARAARASAEVIEDRTRALATSLAAHDRAETERWRAVVAAVEEAWRPDQGERGDLDRAIRLLEIDGPPRSPKEFEAFMGDSGSSLTLAPAPTEPLVSGADRMIHLGARTANGPLSPEETQQLLRRTGRTDVLGNPDRCGLCVLDADGQQRLLLGDGGAIHLEGTRLAYDRASETGGSIRVLQAKRWVTGDPPVLLPHARAGFAWSLVTTGQEVPANNDEIAAWLMFAARIEVGPAIAASAVSLVREIGATLRAAADASAVTAILLRFVHETMRVTVSPSGPTAVEKPDPTASVVDVGRVRWCTLGQRPVVWLPMIGDDPDLVGGADRAWTEQPVAVGAVWHRQSPALQLVPDWHGRIVVVPGSPTLWCVDPDGAWWDLAADYGAIVDSRRAHMERWLRAIEVLDEQMPQAIAACEVVRAASQRPHIREAKEPQAENAEDQPERFSRAWIEQLVSRYDYEDDTEVREAGRRARARGHYSREDFLVVVGWKSRRSLSRAERNTASEIERRTRTAFATKDERARMEALVSLNGVGVPVASALLCFAFPADYPILDFRALEALGDDRRRTQYSPEFWLGYLEHCRQLATSADVGIRELDKALWQASREGDLPRTTHAAQGAGATLGSDLLQ